MEQLKSYDCKDIYKHREFEMVVDTYIDRDGAMMVGV